MRTTEGFKLSLFYLWLQVTEIPVKMMIEVGNLTNREIYYMNVRM